jgi:NADP-dependent 3-hydroxy acid dehydrogenase YdfG
MSSLKNKIALVTGATSGIGLAITEALISLGTKVYMIGRNSKKLEKIFGKDFNANPNIVFIKTDFSNSDEINSMLDQLKTVPKIDILIHSAGVISLGPIESHKIEKLDYHYQVNVRSRYLITQQLISKIKKAKGEILFLNSTAGLGAWENIGQYSATKHATRALTESLRKELAKDKIKVTSFYLGSTATPMQEYVQKEMGNEYEPKKYLSPKEVASIVVSILKLSKNVAVTDIIIKSN